MGRSFVQELRNMTFFLFKAPEHTWGTPGISGWGQGGAYNTTKFRQDINNTCLGHG